MEREKLEGIMNAVLEELTDSCTSCDITNDIIDKQSFICCPDITYVTYRARLKGTFETDSGSLILLIEEWVRRGVNISVTGLLLTVDADGQVAISSLNERECSPTKRPASNTTNGTDSPTTTPASNTTNGTDSPTTTSTAIVGVVVSAASFIMISGVVIIVIVIVIIVRKFKNCGAIEYEG